MTVYYVDYENVHAGIDGVDKLSAEDVVRVFYSPKADTMRIAFVEQALNAQAKIELVSVDVGTPNALDFQLVAWLYSELSSAAEEHVIVSNDHGYDAAVRMGVRLGLPQVRRVSCIAEALGLQPTQLEDAPGKRRSSSRRWGQRRRGTAAATEVAEAADIEEAAKAVVEDVSTAGEDSLKAAAKIQKEEEASAKPEETSAEAGELQVERAATGEESFRGETSELSLEAAETSEESSGFTSEEAQTPKTRRTRRHRRTPAKSVAVDTSDSAQDAATIPAASEPEAEPDAQFEFESPAEPKPGHASAAMEVEPAAQSALASESIDNPEAAEPVSEAVPKPRRSRRRRSVKAEAAKADATHKVVELLAAQEIALLEDQLNVVVKSAQSAASKQEFYRTIIQKLGQKQGLSVYGQVKSLFKDLSNAVALQEDVD